MLPWHGHYEQKYCHECKPEHPCKQGLVKLSLPVPESDIILGYTHLDATKSKVRCMEFLLIEEIQDTKREFLMKHGNLSEADATSSEF